MGNLSQMVSGELQTKLYSDTVHPSTSSMFCTDCTTLQIFFLRGPAFLTHCLDMQSTLQFSPIRKVEGTKYNELSKFSVWKAKEKRKLADAIK